MVPEAHQVCTLMPLLMTRTEPSLRSRLTAPGWTGLLLISHSSLSLSVVSAISVVDLFDLLATASLLGVRPGGHRPDRGDCGTRARASRGSRGAANGRGGPGCARRRGWRPPRA